MERPQAPDYDILEDAVQQEDKRNPVLLKRSKCFQENKNDPCKESIFCSKTPPPKCTDSKGHWRNTYFDTQGCLDEAKQLIAELIRHI